MDVDFREPRTVAVVGGLGRMGLLMGTAFREAGYEVTVADSREGTIHWEGIGRHDVIVLAVPISAMDSVMRNLGPFTREDGLVLDIASLKAAPVQSMLEHARGEVIGTHPLFGPAVSSFKEQLVFVCPARSEHWIAWFRAFLGDRGARVRDIDPVQHDRLMGTVQVLRHLLVFCFGRSLMRLEYDLASDLAFSGPWFSQLMDMVRNQVAENPGLYAELAFPNPIMDDVVACFAQEAEAMCSAYRSRDIGALIDKIDELAKYVNPCTARSDP
jgi:prephenate dehydrogenase